MTIAPARPRPSAPESPVDRLARLYGLKERIELEIAAAEALLEGQGIAVRMLQNRYAVVEPGRDTAGRRRQAVCGTDGGYHRHRRKLKDDPCKPCKIAHAEAERDRARRAREVD